MTKKNEYNPEAFDADGDGIVQEGTEYEREVGAVCCGKFECQDCPLDEPVEWLEDPVVVPRPVTSYVAKDGDSYASIAAAHKPKGVTSFAYAKDLYEANNGKAIRAGVEVIL